jgi:non-heme chloroperoxidase
MKILAAGMMACLFVVIGCGSSAPEEDEFSAEWTSIEPATPTLHSVTLSTGVTLQYLEQGRADGRPVIFLHGYTDSHHSFDLNLPRFPRRFHVYALDQRGHGGSSKLACDCYRQSDFSDDVIAFMDQLGIATASLVGHSMGSFIAHKVAAEHPSRVDKLVLVGSATTVAGNAGALELKTIVDTLEDPIDPEFVRAFQASTFFQPIPESFLNTAVAESLRVPAAIWKRALDGLIEEDHTGALGQITAETLIFWGDQDVFFFAEHQADLVAAIPGANLITYADTGHGLHVERPKRFVRDLRHFLR